MKIQTFEPGDGVCYLIAVDRITPEQTERLGLAEVMFFFGHFTAPLIGWAFRDGEHAGCLEFNYFVSKMVAGRALMNSYDTCAAYHVACELLGRREDMPPQQPEQMDWRADWRDLLAELKGELNREQE